MTIFKVFSNSNNENKGATVEPVKEDNVLVGADNVVETDVHNE